MKKNFFDHKTQGRLLLIVLIIAYITLSMWALGLEKRNGWLDTPTSDEVDNEQMTEMQEYQETDVIVFK